MKNAKRWVAVGVAVATGMMGLEAISPAMAGATQVDLVCTGATGDNASGLGDSKSTLAALATFTGGGGLSFSVNATANAPSKVTPSSGPFDATFDLALTMPDSIVKAARDTLGLKTVNVTNATFAVTATGAANAVITKTVPSIAVDLTKSPVTVYQTLSGKITPTSAGTISYKPGGTTLSIGLNTVFQGIALNTITVSCGSNKEIGSTGVQVPGAPSVPQVIFVGGSTGGWTSRQVIPNDIAPDNGNPIDYPSLKVTSQASNGGIAFADGAGRVAFLAPTEPGLYYVNHEVCAAAKVVPAVPGVNAAQTLSWPETYVGRDLNVHPYSMALQFKGAKTAAIPLSYFLGQPSPTGPGQQGFADQFLAQFQAPSAGQIQAALEALPTIGKGNVSVSGGYNNSPYTITFQGALGGADQPKVEVVDWNTWLPADGLSTILAVLNPPAIPGVTTTVAPPLDTVEQLDAKLAAGTINFDQYLAGRGAILKADIIAGATTPAAIKTVTGLFPKAPEVQTTVDGKAPIAEGTTGPMCSRFDVGYLILRPQAAVQGATQFRAPAKSKVVCKTQRVKVRVKVNGKYRTKMVTKKVCKRVKA